MSFTVRGDLLDRLVLIQKDITGIADASRRWWEPLTPTGVFPRFANRYDGGTHDNVVTGRVESVLRVRMRLITGCLTSGYRYEHEDNLITLYDLVLETFSRRPRLNHPSTAASDLQYIRRAQIVEDTGVNGFVFDTPTQTYIGTDFILSVELTLNIGRIS